MNDFAKVVKKHLTCSDVDFQQGFMANGGTSLQAFAVTNELFEAESEEEATLCLRLMLIDWPLTFIQSNFGNLKISTFLLMSRKNPDPK